MFDYTQLRETGDREVDVHCDRMKLQLLQASMP